MAEIGNLLSTEVNATVIGEFTDEKFDEVITASGKNKKISSLSKHMTNKACQVNFEKRCIETCFKSGCQTLQNKNIAEESKFLREQINKKNFIIRWLFSMKLSNGEEDNFPYKIKTNANRKNILKVVMLMKSRSVNVELVR